jgi:hypothetical protein
MSLPLALLLLLIAVLPWAAEGSVQMARRAELEASLLCYRRAAPALWNTFVAALPAEVSEDLDALAGKASLLLEMLRARVPPCTAIERVTRTRLPGGNCPAAVSEGPLRMCLNGAHSGARGAVFEPAERERATAANARMWATREEALTYSSDAGSYSDAHVRAVVAEAVRRKV